MILLAVVNAQPKELGLVQAIGTSLTTGGRHPPPTAYLLSKAKDREHILEGYLTALDHLDNVIVIIRASANRAEARENLVAYFAGKKIDINITGRTPKRDPEKPFTRFRPTRFSNCNARLTKLSIDEITKNSTSPAKTSPSTKRSSVRKRTCAADRERTGRSKKCNMVKTAAP